MASLSREVIKPGLGSLKATQMGRGRVGRVDKSVRSGVGWGGVGGGT